MSLNSVTLTFQTEDTTEKERYLSLICDCSYARLSSTPTINAETALSTLLDKRNLENIVFEPRLSGNSKHSMTRMTVVKSLLVSKLKYFQSIFTHKFSEATESRINVTATSRGGFLHLLFHIGVFDIQIEECSLCDELYHVVDLIIAASYFNALDHLLSDVLHRSYLTHLNEHTCILLAFIAHQKNLQPQYSLALRQFERTRYHWADTLRKLPSLNERQFVKSLERVAEGIQYSMRVEAKEGALVLRHGDKIECVIPFPEEIIKMEAPISGYAICTSADGYDLYLSGGEFGFGYGSWNTSIYYLSTITRQWRNCGIMPWKIRSHISCCDGQYLYLFYGVDKFRVKQRSAYSINLETLELRRVDDVHLPSNMMQASLVRETLIDSSNVEPCLVFFSQGGYQDAWSFVEIPLELFFPPPHANADAARAKLRNLLNVQQIQLKDCKEDQYYKTRFTFDHDEEKDQQLISHAITWLPDSFCKID